MVPEQTKLEAETRKEIDEKLNAAGWEVSSIGRAKGNMQCGIRKAKCNK